MSSNSCPKPSCLKVENYICHNGDFDFFRVNDIYCDLNSIQDWLVKATGAPMPTSVDSCAIAGMIDMIHTSGCFALSARFALLLGMSGSTISANDDIPSWPAFEEVGTAFEVALEVFCAKHLISPAMIGDSEDLRQGLTLEAARTIEPAWYYSHEAFTALMRTDVESAQGGTTEFVRSTINAFFDNDLFQTTKYFLDNAKGSFGLFVSCSLDAHRSICLAARGQTMSIAFYPKKGLICYGSEQAAVKAGMNFQAPGGHEWTRPISGASHDDETLRLDLDDLGGEVCLIDWGQDEGEALVSVPNRHLQQHLVLRGSVVLVLHQESIAAPHGKLYSRMTLLEGNEFVQALPEIAKDLILFDIQDIPRACKAIQQSWANVGLNRLTGWNLSRCLKGRLNDRISGKIPSHAGTADILLTGCEVSLWLAEQFASDLQKVFPRLFIKSVSSNKLLGMFGQDMAIPSVGYPISTNNPDLHDTIVIIVSHSGGTFAPLACSNLLQASTKNIFVVTSEWDTQIGKQLRSMADDKMTASHIFSTDIGLRPAEPCSISVAATQQLLTLLFEHICLTILSTKEFRHLSGALITESDLQILERCNQDCIHALENIVGVDCEGNRLQGDRLQTERSLRDAGRLWSDHVLENARAYVMSFIYIMVTVTSGFPIVTGLAKVSGLDTERTFYITRCLDALIYFFLPQINITILRLLQGRNLLHRMVGRTVVIGDIPWVAQAGDAFLSKIFACSYSIAGINVLHGNPTDHLVHRHTHRVVRGSLLVAGRPDGRLLALTSSEATVCLSINQASSIQSLGGTCESITIGHNPAGMSLTKRNIVLETHRPRFLCEQLLDHLQSREALFKGLPEDSPSSNTSPHFLLGAYTGWRKRARGDPEDRVNSETKHQRLIELMIVRKNQKKRRIHKYNSDVNSSDLKLGVDEIVNPYQKLNSSIPRNDSQEFNNGDSLVGRKVEHSAISDQTTDKIGNRYSNRGSRGLRNVTANQEFYFGEELVKGFASRNDQFPLCLNQNLSMELYEGRIASLERFVAMTVMFHELGTNVQKFFPAISLGYLGYSTDRTHSMMRIATTASPVSGADVRERIATMKATQVILQSVRTISNAWFNYRRREAKRLLKQNSLGLLVDISDRRVGFKFNRGAPGSRKVLVKLGLDSDLSENIKSAAKVQKDE